ncbi:MAG: GTP 3',8-cyclase MoaA [Oceanobacter sp.]
MTIYQPGLQDAHGRRFTYLRLSVTEACNFRCNYCLPNGYQKTSETADLSLPEIASVASAFAACGTRKVRVTGGEPSLRKDLPAILETLASTDGIEQIALTTNGYRLEHQLDDWISAGLSRLNLSIDSLDSSRFAEITGHDKLGSLLRGLERALVLGLKVKVNAVLLRGFNYAELARFLDWVKHTPISLRFIELMQTGDNRTFFSEHHVNGQEIALRLADMGWSEQQRSIHDGPAREFAHPDYQGRVGLIMPYSSDFCASCNRLRVSSSGRLHLCLFGTQGHDLRPLLQPDRQSELIDELHRLLELKEPTHYLQQGHTGATRHFAMLGG